MLNDATCFKAVYIVCGYTDLRAGMDRLAALVEAQTGNRPYIKDTLYLFCGRRTDRIKGLVWEGDGYIITLSTRKMYDEGGRLHYCVDETLRRRLETKLITKILAFEAV